MPPLVETEEEVSENMEQGVVDKDDRAFAPALYSTTRSSTTEETADDTVCEDDSDVGSTLLRARRKKTQVTKVSSDDQRKTSASKRSKSSNVSDVEVEPSGKQGAAPSTFPATPRVIVNRPSPILLRSLAKPSRGKGGVGVCLEVSESSKL